MTFSLPPQRRVTATTAAASLESECCADTHNVAALTRLPILQTRTSKLTKNAPTTTLLTAARSERAALSNQRQSSVMQREQQQQRRRRLHGPAAIEPAVRLAGRASIHAMSKSKSIAAAAGGGGGGTVNASSTHALSVMDERILMLYHASLKQSWVSEAAASATALQQLQDERDSFERARLLRKFGHEATLAATQIQRVFRGGAARARLASFDGPRYQRAARSVQFALRWLVVCQRVARRVHHKKVASAVQIQSWYRGCQCRERLLDAQARTLVHGVVLLQRHVRGHRFWRVVAALLHDRRCRAATEMQRCVRGRYGRLRAVAVRFEQQRYVRHLSTIAVVHRRRARCARCELAQCSEDSLFDCFMARYVGLHDLLGARALCLGGLRLFPSSGRFCFFYAVLTLVMCDDVCTAMAFLNRALRVLHVSDDELATCEQQYLIPALQLRPNDAAAYLDLAVFCQCGERIARAKSHYAKALALLPTEYAIPGYLHRVRTLDRLLGNYHRFCSLFNSQQTNVLAKVLAVAKRGEQLRIMVAKMNQFTAIYATDAANASRVSALYLSDDEVRAFLSEHGSAVTTDKVSANDLAVAESESAFAQKRTLSNLASWRKSSFDTSTSQRTKRSLARDSPASDMAANVVASSTSAASPLLPTSRSFELVQLFQSEFRGLNVRPAKLAAPSEKRSKLSLTRDHAELLLKHLVFLNAATTTSSSPAAGASDAPSSPSLVDADTALPVRTTATTAAANAPPAYIILLPSLLKMQQHRRAAAQLSHAAIDLQRVFRGFQLRAQMRRERLIQSIQQQQVDHMLAQLQANVATRERRRASAVAIQRIVKGVALRRHLRQWHIDATQIQRVFRGFRGRKRALAFRDGNCTFYMTERVYQRGVEISGRRVMLSIDKCGLSFRFYGYDLEHCATFPGFVSHASTLALLCHVNWRYAESFIGKECAHEGLQLAIAGVGSVNRETAECSMICRVLQANSTGRSSTLAATTDLREVTVSLADCIQSINLRLVSTLGRDAQPIASPLTLDDTPRIVNAIVARLTLEHSLPMASKELKRKTPAGFIIALAPPPKMHMLFQGEQIHSALDRIATQTYEESAQSATHVHHVHIQDPTQIQFPVTDGLRGVSIGTRRFRKKCARHATHFTRCRCVLPVTSTAAHIEVLTLALTPVRVTSARPAPLHEYTTS